MKVQREMRDKSNRLQALQAKYNTLEQVDRLLLNPISQIIHSFIILFRTLMLLELVTLECSKRWSYITSNSRM